MGLFSRKKDSAKDTEPGNDSVTLDDGRSFIVTATVDCIGDSCPRPQLMTKKAMTGAESGAIIEVKIDNPTSMEAIPPLMPELGGTHLGTVKAERHWRVIVQKQ